MPSGLFITGTDTAVGKTLVAAGILRYIVRNEVDAVSMKPVQTGAVRIGNRLIAPDLTFHHAASGLTAAVDELDLMAPYRYEPACSPHLAARLANDYPELHHIENCARALLERHELLIVEGAGGVRAPVNEEATMLDLMQALGFPVILVARRGLGTINHSLLSIDAIRNEGLDLLGVVFNEVENVQPDFIREDNPDAVANFADVRILGNVDYLEPMDLKSAETWRSFESCMPGLQNLDRVWLQT